MRLTIALLATLALALPVQAQYGYYYPPYVTQIVEKVTVVNQLVTVPAPVALFTFNAAPTTPPPVFIAAKIQAPAAPKADPCCASLDLTARLARIEQALAAFQPGGPPMLQGGPPRLRPLAQAPAAPPAIKLHPEIASVVSLMRRSCAECHTAPGRGGVVLFDEQGSWEPNVSPREILAAVRPGKDASGAPRPPLMPKGKQALTAEEVALVERWAKAD